jgi:hypothetical protein
MHPNDASVFRLCTHVDRQIEAALADVRSLQKVQRDAPNT